MASWLLLLNWRCGEPCVEVFTAIAQQTAAVDAERLKHPGLDGALERDRIDLRVVARFARREPLGHGYTPVEVVPAAGRSTKERSRLVSRCSAPLPHTAS